MGLRANQCSSWDVQSLEDEGRSVRPDLIQCIDQTEPLVERMARHLATEPADLRTTDPALAAPGGRSNCHTVERIGHTPSFSMTIQLHDNSFGIAKHLLHRSQRNEPRKSIRISKPLSLEPCHRCIETSF